MPTLPLSTQSDAHAIDTTLVALGFVRGDDGVLYAPTDSVVSFTPVGGFLEMRIVLGDGNALTAVLAKSALKVCRGPSFPSVPLKFRDPLRRSVPLRARDPKDSSVPVLGRDPESRSVPGSQRDPCSH